MPVCTPAVSLIVVALYFAFAVRVARARGRFDVPLPATAGHPDFERIYRAHVNMLEWMPIFLVPLWLAALYLSDIAAATLGLVWIGGRIWYGIGYGVAVEKRLPGFFVQSMACAALFVCSIIGIVRHF